MKILIFDTDVIRGKLLHKNLRTWGFEVFEAPTLPAVMACFEAESPDILILGKPPRAADRLEACRRIRALAPQHRQFLLVIMERPSDKQMMAALEAGADDFLFEPLHLAELRAKIKAGARILNLQTELDDRLKRLEESNRLIRKTSEQMRRDVFAVAKIQASLLPASLPTFPNAEFAWVYKPREELAGDGLNVFRLDEQHVAFYVLDVSGRGTAAALLSVSLSREISPFPSQSTLLKRLKKGPPGYEILSPSQVLTALNATFPLDVDTQQFFTIFYGILNLKNLELRYALAGHPRPYLLSRGEARQLPGGGVPIGFVDGAKFEDLSIILSPGDRLFVYSDGISEAQGSDHELFCRRGLLPAIQRAQGGPFRESLNGLLQEAEDWAQPEGLHDDVSILALEIKEKKE